MYKTWRGRSCDSNRHKCYDRGPSLAVFSRMQLIPDGTRQTTYGYLHLEHVSGARWVQSGRTLSRHWCDARVYRLTFLLFLLRHRVSSTAPVYNSRKYQHYIGVRHYSACCKCILSTCYKRFRRHCSGKSALWRDHYRKYHHLWNWALDDPFVLHDYDFWHSLEGISCYVQAAFFHSPNRHLLGIVSSRATRDDLMSSYINIHGPRYEKQMG